MEELRTEPVVKRRAKPRNSLPARFGVREPPDVGQPRHTVDVNMLRRYQFEQSETPVRPAITALLDAAPRRLRHRVRVNNFVDHHRAGVDLFGELTPATDVAREDADAVRP